MLTKENFSEKHIMELRAENKRDPGLIERAIYALGLLEAISRVGMPFVFKGGSSLLLLLDHPMRLSTDIDIVVAPNTDVDDYIQRAAKIFPFQSCEEQKRIGKNNMVKRHFKFTYVSPLTQRSIYILLDVLFEENKYAHLIEKEIRNELLLTEGECVKVKIPSINSVLGDKLTAFAPHTIGVPIRDGKDMEVAKQLYDVTTLIDVFDNFDEVYDTYLQVAQSEIEYRGLNIQPDISLCDTLCTATSIATRGQIDSTDYPVYLKGIRDVQGYIYYENFTAEIAATKAPKVMYMAACMMKHEPFERISDGAEYIEEQISNPRLKSLKFLKKYDKVSYSYVIKTDRLMGSEFTYELDKTGLV